MNSIKIYTTSRCGDCAITKTLLEELNVPFEEINIEADPDAADYVTRVNDGKRSVPTLVYNGDAASLSRFNRAKLDAFLRRNKLY